MKQLLIIITLTFTINCIGQTNFEHHKNLKKQLIQKHIINPNSKNNKTLIFGVYSNSIAGGAISNLTLYPDSVYKFEYIGQAYGFYDIGKFTYKQDTLTLTSNLSSLTDTSQANYHNKIIDLTGVTFSLSEFIIYKRNTYLMLSSFGKIANSLKIANNGKNQWVKPK